MRTRRRSPRLIPPRDIRPGYDAFHIDSAGGISRWDARGRMLDRHGDARTGPELECKRRWHDANALLFDGLLMRTYAGIRREQIWVSWCTDFTVYGTRRDVERFHRFLAASRALTWGVDGRNRTPLSWDVVIFYEVPPEPRDAWLRLKQLEFHLESFLQLTYA